MAVALTLALLFGLIVIRVPIAFSIGICATAYTLLAGLPSLTLTQQIANGPDSWVLLALPLFVLAGIIMNKSGMSDDLIAFANAIIGFVRGGLAMVNVMTSMLFGGMSGSAVADASAVGSILIPGMERSGYPKPFSAALTSSSASIGIIIPPSIPMILFGAITGAPVAVLFIAGIIPGVLVGLSQMGVIYWMARRRGWAATTRLSLREIWRTFRAAAIPLFMPILMIGGILGGIFTPTEAGGVAVVYGLAVAAIYYRVLTWRILYDALVQTGVVTAVVMLVVATSYALGWVLAYEHVPEAVAAFFAGVPGSREVTLLLISVLLILLGCILHGNAEMVLTVPVLLPAVAAAGIDLIQFGMVVVLCIAIGQQTPPVGSVLFAISGVARLDIFTISRANVPFVMTLILVLLLVIFFPGIATYLPRITGML